MPIISPKGSPDSPVWVICEKPLSSDIDKGYLFSSNMGYVFDKMMKEAGFDSYYTTCIRPDTDSPTNGGDIDSYLHHHKPRIIIPLDNAGKWYAKEMQTKFKRRKIGDDEDSEISKYCGSLLTCDRFDWPHYIIPTLGPANVVKQWKQRDIVINCDLGKAYSELEYYKKHGSLEPLPIREHKIEFESFDELLYIIDSFLEHKFISNDIETIYPKAPTKTQPSQFYKILPGYPITIALAISATYSISFDFFRPSTVETRELWKHLAKLMWEVPSIGQNFFNFDANFYEMLGFRLPLDKCRDTMIRHHLLWAELKHTLQFQTRQYTREVYYKSEGHGWSIKDLAQLKRYGCKDVLVTYEIYEKQEIEMQERGLL